MDSVVMLDNGQSPPPVNNLLQPDIYNRLDAEIIERTRVANTQLDERLRLQQRILAKYRVAAERFHRREKERMQKELSKISAKLPSLRNIRTFRNNCLYGERRLRNGPLALSIPDLPTRKIRGVPDEKPGLPFCERFFLHHLPGKQKYYKSFISSRPCLTTREVMVVIEGEGERLPAVAISDAANCLQADGEKLSSQVKSETRSKSRSSSAIMNDHTSPAVINDHNLSETEKRFANQSSAVRHDPVSSRRSDSVTCTSCRDRKWPRHNADRSSFPPIRLQTLRLSLSSPQLFHC